MPLFIIACLVSFLPFILIYLWLKKRAKDNKTYCKICDKAFISGLLSVLPILLLSMVSNILLNLTGIRKTNPLLYQGLYTFIILAFAEELVKFLCFKKILKKNEYAYSWLDMVALMTIVGSGFGLIESVTYAIGASIPVVLVRGICAPHVGYGFIVGYFYGKGLKNRNSGTKMLGFILAWLIHGLYDFSLSSEFIALNDNLIAVALVLAVFDIVLVIMLIRFVKKAGKNEKYLVPLGRI